MNAKKSLEGSAQEPNQRDSVDSRLEAPNSSEDEAINTLRREKRIANINEKNPTTSQTHEKKSPRPRGRPRKERPFEVMF